jgi:hypothetical protein
VPAQLVTGFQQGIASGQVDLNGLTGTGDLGQTILANAGAQAALIQPFITNIVAGIHAAFSLAVAQTFWIAVGAAIISAVAAAGMQELRLRQSTVAQERATATGATPEAQRPAVPAAE